MKTLTGTVVFLLVAACATDTDSWDAVEDVKPFAAKAETAKRARDALAKQLLQELSAALKKGGPERGIAVCRDRAPAIARSVAEAHGVAIGRTSFKLRNPDNQPPEWARAAVAKRAESATFFSHPSGRFGALYPIRLGGQCVVCHGTPDKIAPGVREALKQHYPADRATGFQPEDLRGWFWVEVQ